MYELRPYQTKLIHESREAFRDHQGVFIVLPTGGGKTIVFSEILKGLHARGKSGLVLAHRQELVHQAADKLRDNAVPHGVIMQSLNTNPNSRIQVASKGTLLNRQLYYEPDLIVIDEAHLIAGEGYSKLVQRWPKAKRLLVSATPKRLDRKGFTEFASVMVQGPTFREMVEMGYLVPPRVLVGKEKLSLDGISAAQDFNENQLSQYMSQNKLVGDVVDAYTEHANGLTGVCFATSIEHSQKLTNQFNHAGIKAEHLDGKSPDRAGILARLRSGETRIVSNCDVLCEGWDEPSIGVVIMARPTMSEALYIQQCGRGARLHPGKEEFIIIDCAGNTERHGPLTMDREWSLEAIPKQKRGKREKAIIPTRQCLFCGAVYEYQDIDDCCPVCLKAPPKETYDHADGVMVPFDDQNVLKYEILRYFNTEKQKLTGTGGRPEAAFYRVEYKYGYDLALQYVPEKWHPWAVRTGKYIPQPRMKLASGG